MQTLTLQKTIVKDLSLCLLGTFLICLSGGIAIPLWFTPVPLVTQNGVVLLTGALLGSRRAALSVFAFLALGALGLPVFTKGNGGFHIFLGPTGGYLIGYLISAVVTGYMIEKGRSILSSLTIGAFVIYFCGVTVLSTFIGLKKALLLGVLPFVIGDILKILISTKTYGWIRKLQE
jgi:biotin transport system substrate-specific component